VEVVKLAHETDFDGWRRAARALRARGVVPDAVLWTVDGAPILFDDAGPGPGAHGEVFEQVPGFTTPKAFVDLAEQVTAPTPASRCSTGCCGGCSVSRACCTSPPTPTSARRACWPRTSAAPRTR
jgi:hypothetical protein